MIIYLLKATLCALFFFLIYVLLLEKEKMHRFKRVYLLCSLAFSLIIPLVAVNLNRVAPQLAENIKELYIEDNVTVQNAEQLVIPVGIGNEESTFSEKMVDYMLILKALYIIVTFVFILRMCRNIILLFYSTKKGKRLIDSDKKIVLIQDQSVPYSFGSYIYVNEDDYKNGLIGEEIIKHEQAHINQKHSIDILFIELLIAIGWFNPVLYLFRRKIKENHEFLADDVVLKGYKDITNYQNILINIISKKGSIGLASSLNYSTIKKRFIMMKRETSPKKARYKKAMLIPALLLALCMFSTHTIADSPSTILSESVDETKSIEEDFIVPGKGVSDELVKEYQNIVEKHLEEVTKISDNRIGIKWKNHDVSDTDRDRLYMIYLQMDSAQRWNQLIKMVGPFNPMKCRAPSKGEWNSAKRAEVLWFNGKKANTSVLDTYTRKDIHFFINNYIDEEKVVYQSALWTKKEYEEYIKQYKEKIPLSVLLEIKPQIGFLARKEPQGKRQ